MSLKPKVATHKAVPVTPEVTKPSYKVLGRTASGEANLVITDEGVLLERIATGKQRGWWKTIIGETQYVAQTRERVLEIARERGAILPKAKAITPEVAIPKAKAGMSQMIRNPICIDCGRKIPPDKAVPVKFAGKKAYICHRCYYAGVPAEMMPRFVNPQKHWHWDDWEYVAYDKAGHELARYKTVGSARKVPGAYKVAAFYYGKPQWHEFIRNPASLYQAFHGVPSIRQRKVKVNVLRKGDRLVKLGRLLAVQYLPEHPSKLKGVAYEHTWGDTGTIMLPDKPILATSEDGKDFYIIKDRSRAKLTARGIVG